MVSGDTVGKERKRLSRFGVEAGLRGLMEFAIRIESMVVFASRGGASELIPGG